MNNFEKSSSIESNFQILTRNKTFKRANEILYLFYSGDKFNWPSISKIGVQKCLYLSEVLSPLREIILSYLNFIYLHRGPYSKDVQNTLDYLVSLNAIEVISFTTSGESSYADYRITEAGKSIVQDLVLYPPEYEKQEWIQIVTKVVDAYKGGYNLSEQYKGVDKIIDIVYQEPSFKEVKQRGGKREFIRMADKNNLTMQLIDFLQSIEKSLPPSFDRDKYKLDLETVLLSFFEYLYVEHLSQSKHNG